MAPFFGLATPCIPHAGERSRHSHLIRSTFLGTSPRGEIHHFPDKGLGTSAAYKNNDLRCNANFYVYDLGHSFIPEGTESDIVRETFLESEDNIFEYARRGELSHLRRLSPSGLMTHFDAKSPRFLMSIFEYVAGGELRVSWLFVTGTRQHFFKIRYTCPASQPTAAGEALRRLVTSFFEANAD